MNLALHGLLLQVIVSIVQLQHGIRLCSAGEPGYLDFDNLPETNFSCQGKVIGGYYADVEAGCQMFHVCTIGQKDEIMDIKFLCLNGTVFDQETRVCERVDEVDCSKSERFYNLNLELYGNNAVTLSLHETSASDEIHHENDHDLVEEHESQRTTSSRPSTTSSTTTTTTRPSISSTGYPQHFQPQPRFPSVQTSQSKSLYDDKNGGYHHQYIYHTGDHRNNNVDANNDGSSNNNNNQNHNGNSQATSYQLFSNQGVSSTTGAPQIHQIRYSSTPNTQIQIHNDHQPTVSPIFHATSSTIQTLLNSNANSPALINPIFHSHGIASTTEQFTVHNNNPRETAEYSDDGEDDERDEDDRRPLEPIQPTTQGKVSKLTVSPPHEDNDRPGQQGKNNQQQQQQQRITTSFLPTPASDAGQAVRTFYPTPRTSTKSSSSHVTHIHLPPPPAIPQLKPHQVTINLPPPDIQRIVQNPSPLLPSQSRVIVTAKASVSDESGRPLNSTQLVTLPLPTIPSSYDDYKEGDESFDPFYRDVPKVRNGRWIGGKFRWDEGEPRDKRSLRRRRDIEEVKVEEEPAVEISTVAEKAKMETGEIERTTKMENVEESKDSQAEIEGTEMKKHLKTMSSKYRLDANSDEKDDGKLAVDAEETDEPDYVDTRETDAEEYVNVEDEAFDSKIFDEPESQTSKEVEVRAVDQQDSKYAKDRSDRLDNTDKNTKSGSSNSLGSSKGHEEEKSSRFSLALPEVVDSKSQEKHATKEEPKPEISPVEEETLEGMEEEISQENLPEEDYYYYDEETDDSDVKSNEDSVENSKESPNKIEPSKHESSRRGKTLQDDADEEDDYDPANDSTTRSNEQMDSDEMSDEYVHPDDFQEVQEDETPLPMSEENATQEFASDSASSTEQTGSSEATTSDGKKSHIDKNLSDGVLKFTDEIPSTEKTQEPEEAERSESVEETPQDYIDDNYEPQSYKEQKVSSTMETVTTGEDTNSSTLDDKDVTESPTTAASGLAAVEDLEEKQNDQAQPENKPETVHMVPIEESIEKPIEIEMESAMTSTTSASIIDTTTISTTTPATTTTTISTTTPAESTTISTTTPAESTTIPTTTTTTTTTSPAATTTTTPTTTTMTRKTTVRPTTTRPTPKLFKPFTVRKNYVYIPPTTTPVPVVIKPRLPLLNPKPAKPIKSYNELAPKPVIRKSPLFARKTLMRTTTTQETRNPEEKIPEKTTENPKMQEATLSPVTTTEVPTTQATESSSASATKSPSTIGGENSSIRDNNLPTLVTESSLISSSTESQTFTPYPMLRLAEAIAKAEKDVNHTKENYKTDITTTEKSYVESNDVPSVNEHENSSRTPETISVAVPENSSSDLSQNDPHKSQLPLVEPISDSSITENNVATNKPQLDVVHQSTSTEPDPDEVTTEIGEVINRTPTLASIKAVNRRPGVVKRTGFFNCLEREMYRFYADGRDCRLFHYCSPGFTSRQVLDFRFVCEEGTAFDEETQSCIHDVKSPECRMRVW